MTINIPSETMVNISITKLCGVCGKEFGSNQSNMFVERRRISNNQVVHIAYHSACVGKYMEVTKRKGRQAAKPVGRYGAKTGG